MNIRFFNARILTMKDKKQKIFEGELWTENERIIYTGPGEGAQGFPIGRFQKISWDREINAKGNLLMPGFKNAHTHTAMTFLRSYADDLPLMDWLHKQVFPREAKLTAEDVYWFSKLGFLEYLTSGITACFDMYMQPDAFAKAAVETGFRSVLCGRVNDFGGDAKSLEEEYLRFNEADPLITYQLGFHAEYTTAKPLLKDIAKLAQKLKAPVYTHNSETADEVTGCMERYGVTPTVFLDSLGMFAYGGGGFHCVHVSDADLDIFKKHDMWVITNPGSNTKLASGIAPVAKMVKKNINLAIGTDGPASNNCLDMWREMFLTTGLQKLKNKDSASMPAGEVLWMAASGGAKAMGLNDCDSLAAGKLADLIMIDLHRPNMQPEHHIVKNLVYSGSKDNVALTMINGRILYENREFYVGEDPEIIYRESARCARRICE